MIVAVVPTKILQRWDRIAMLQLTQAAARLSDENDELSERLYRAEETAEFWREQAMDMQLQLCEATDTRPGITRSGALVTVEVTQ